MLEDPKIDAAWHDFVFAYDIDVPEERVKNELEFIELDLRHRMQYDRLSGGENHFFPTAELAEQQDELRKAAYFEAKEPLVLRALIADYNIIVTQEELEEEAQALAAREHTSLQLIQSFFGDDFALLKGDIAKRKAIERTMGLRSA